VKIVYINGLYYSFTAKYLIFRGFDGIFYCTARSALSKKTDVDHSWITAGWGGKSLESF
jgi:hypothetical protein